MIRVLSASAAFAVTGVAFGAPVFYPQLGGDSVLQPRDETRIEARFRADATNWDTRLEYDSFPENGDLTGAVGNNKSFFENQGFGFELSYDHVAQEITWTIAGRLPSTAVLNSLTQPTDTLGQLNTLQIFTTGSRGEVMLSDVQFIGLGMDVLAFPDVNSQPLGPTFSETFLFFGDTFNLLSGDWTLSGTLNFGAFTSHSNPSEGAKVTVKLRNAEIPAPGAIVLAGMAGAAAMRRRR